MLFRSRPYNAHKIDFCSTLCVFLSYCPNHVGYRCLDLHTNKMYIARHIRFNEICFPFASFSYIPRPTPFDQPPWAIVPVIPSQQFTSNISSLNPNLVVATNNTSFINTHSFYLRSSPSTALKSTPPQL